MPMPGRSYTSENYRFGFNGMEKDDEMKGSGNSLDFGARIYDSRLGKFLSVDPLTKNYPFYTPYKFAGNKPIAFIDKNGEHEFIIHAQMNSKTSKLEVVSVQVINTKSKEHTFYVYDGVSNYQPQAYSTEQSTSSFESSHQKVINDAIEMYNTAISDKNVLRNEGNKNVKLTGFDKPRITQSELARGAGMASFVMYKIMIEINPLGRALDKLGGLEENQTKTMATGEDIDKSFGGRLSGASELIGFATPIATFTFNSIESGLNELSDGSQKEILKLTNSSASSYTDFTSSLINIANGRNVKANKAYAAYSVYNIISNIIDMSKIKNESKSDGDNQENKK